MRRETDALCFHVEMPVIARSDLAKNWKLETANEYYEYVHWSRLPRG